MTEGAGGAEGAPGTERRRRVAEARRRRRLAAAFGETLPDRTTDEDAEGWGEGPPPAGGAGEEWLRRQVPPHHG